MLLEFIIGFDSFWIHLIFPAKLCMEPVFGFCEILKSACQWPLKLKYAWSFSFLIWSSKVDICIWAGHTRCHNSSGDALRYQWWPMAWDRYRVWRVQCSLFYRHGVTDSTTREDNNTRPQCWRNFVCWWTPRWVSCIHNLCNFRVQWLNW